MPSSWTYVTLLLITCQKISPTQRRIIFHLCQAAQHPPSKLTANNLSSPSSLDFCCTSHSRPVTIPSSNQPINHPSPSPPNLSCTSSLATPSEPLLPSKPIIPLSTSFLLHVVNRSPALLPSCPPALFRSPVPRPSRPHAPPLCNLTSRTIISYSTCFAADRDPFALLFSASQPAHSSFVSGSLHGELSTPYGGTRSK